MMLSPAMPTRQLSVCLAVGDSASSVFRAVLRMPCCLAVGSALSWSEAEVGK
jgi:hypothetical protein